MQWLNLTGLLGAMILGHRRPIGQVFAAMLLLGSVAWAQNGPLENPSWEDGKAGWSDRHDGFTADCDNNSVDGDCSLLFVAGVNPRRPGSMFESQTITMPPGCWKVSVWIRENFERVVGRNKTVELSLQLWNKTTRRASLDLGRLGNASPGTHDWTKYEGMMNVVAPTPCQFRAYAHRGGASWAVGWGRFDDIRIVSCD